MFQFEVGRRFKKFKVEDFLHKGLQFNSLANTKLVDAYGIFYIANFLEEVWVTVFELTKPGKTASYQEHQEVSDWDQVVSSAHF